MSLRIIRMIQQRTHACAVVCVFACLAPLSGCTTYEPVPVCVPAASAFDRSWNAAIAAAQDEGVRITSEDRANGVIRGYKGELELTISIRTPADGKVRVEISSRGPEGSDPGLARRISRAYNQRMGR